jgi:hypothetical protein
LFYRQGIQGGITMAKSKQNNLTLSTVKKKSKELDQTRVHTIENGQYIGEQITFQPIFDNVKIEELLTEFRQLLKEADERKLKLSQDIQIYLIYMLTIKHFSHFKDSIPSSLFGDGKKEGLRDWLDHFRKTELMDECINRMFLKEQIKRVFERTTDFAATGLLAMDLDEEMKKKFQELQLQNENIYKQLDSLKLENPIVE